jgi:glycerol kinase
MTCILALDQGTSSSRALVFDESGVILATARQPIEQIYPRPGWVEQDPEQIWSTQRDVARQALAQAGRRAGDVAAIGIANQRETVVLWERATGRALHNAILWQDRRTAAHVERLRDAGHEAHLRERTGLVLDPYFSATKIAWLLDHVPAARRRAEAGELATGTIDSWLLWKLTDGAVHATDVTNASRTQLFDLAKLVWTTSCWSCSMYRGRCCPTCTPAAASWPIRRPIYSVPRCRSPGSPAISKRPCSASSARAQGWRKTPTAPDVSC